MLKTIKKCPNLRKNPIPKKLWDGSGLCIKILDDDRYSDKYTALSPDGDQIIAGTCCYSAYTGELERVYKGMSGYPVFNPLNNRQFISGTKIWELPAPSSVSYKQVAKNAFNSISCHASSGNLILHIQSPHGEKAIITLYQPNGRCILKRETVITDARQQILLPKLSRGTYIWQVEAPSISAKNQGKIIIQ